MRGWAQVAILLGLTAPVRSQSALPAHPQAVNEYQLKAAFVFNFAKFVEWPAEAFRSPTQGLLICLVGDTEIADPLEEAIRGKTVGDRRIAIQRRTVTGSDCHIVFVSGKGKRRPLSAELKAGPFLTVGEEEGFISQGGVVLMKVQADRIQLEINLAAAERAKLRISSKLLSLASVVRK